jgi:hypothetical protein
VTVIASPAIAQIDDPEVQRLRDANASVRDDSNAKPQAMPRPKAVQSLARSCEQVKKRLPKLAAKDAPPVPCTSTDPGTKSTAEEPAGGLPEGLPAWCVDAGDGQWLTTRVNACTWRTESLSWIDVRTGEEVGTMKLTLWYDIVTAWNEGTFIFGHSVYSYNQQGYYSPTSYFLASPFCSGQCEHVSTTPSAQQTLQINSMIRWDTRFRNTLPLPGRGPMDLDGELTFVDPNVGEELNLSPEAEFVPTVRCDDGRLRGYQTTEGCVIRDYWPTLVFKYAEMPTIVDHIRYSQSVGSPGKPGTTPLQRMYNDTDADDNRTEACGNVAIPNPQTQNCDEYPMAHTYQGAITCGCDDWTSRPVLIVDNNAQGIAMATFFRDNRILDADAFWVDTTIP